MSYELLEQSKREFKKDSRRVAIKVKAFYFRCALFLVSFCVVFTKHKIQNFPERTKKEEIDALLSSYHIETTHTDKNNESCKVRVPRTHYAVPQTVAMVIPVLPFLTYFEITDISC